MYCARNDMAENKRVIVTGGAGFIGSAYLNYAVPRYPAYSFLNIDALTYAGRLENIDVTNAPNYAFEKADIRETAELTRIFESFAPTDIIHFAAESHVDISIQNPGLFVETNVLGTHTLLLLAMKRGIRRFHHISTDEVYGSLAPDDQSSKEENALLPNSPYSASKAAAEALVRAYNKTYGLDTIITRSSNNYGPRQHEEKLIPLFITNLRAGKKVPVYGSGTNVRNWIYIDDNVRGVDSAFHNGKSGEVYNLGGNDELSNMELTRMLLDALGKDEDMIEHVPDRLGHDFRYSLNSSKARSELGWHPVTSLDEGLARTIEYYAGR